MTTPFLSSVLYSEVPLAVRAVRPTLLVTARYGQQRSTDCRTCLSWPPRNIRPEWQIEENSCHFIDLRLDFRKRLS